MSSGTENFIDKIKKNPIVAGAIVFVIVVLIVIIIAKMRSNSNTPKPTTKEGFNFSDDETFSLSNLTEEDAYHLQIDSSDDNDDNDIVENFPQPAPMNVMYSDANGNLATTTDLGLQNLTIAKDGALLIGNKFRFNSNKDAWTDDEWLRMMNPENTGYGLAAGKLYGASTIISDGTISAVKNISTKGSISADGAISAAGRISSDAGYAMLNNRNVKPNQLAGGNLQFGFGSMDNNNGGPYADTIHLNGWGDSSGGKPNLVMFDKSKPGMRIYQGEYNSGTAYNTYKDAVMADSNGNASVGGVLSSNTGQFGNLGTYNGADNASAANQNGGLTSWWGIGFRNTLPAGSPARSASIDANNGTSHVFDTRTGNTSMRGDLTADGTIRCSQICIGNTCIGEKELKYLTTGFYLDAADLPRSDNVNERHWKNWPIHVHSNGQVAIAHVASAIKFKPLMHM